MPGGAAAHPADGAGAPASDPGRGADETQPDSAKVAPPDTLPAPRARPIPPVSNSAARPDSARSVGPDTLPASHPTPAPQAATTAARPDSARSVGPDTLPASYPTPAPQAATTAARPDSARSARPDTLPPSNPAPAPQAATAAARADSFRVALPDTLPIPAPVEEITSSDTSRAGLPVENPAQPDTSKGRGTKAAPVAAAGVLAAALAAGDTAAVRQAFAQFPFWVPPPGLCPSQQAFLFRVVSEERWADVIRTGGFLKPEIQMREDSLTARLIIPEAPRLSLADQVTQQASPHADDGAIELTRTVRDTPVEPPVRMTQAEYLSRLTQTQFRQFWKETVDQSLRNNATQENGRKGLLRFDLPVQLPSQLQTIFGAGNPDLSWRGSEKMSFGGTSIWHPNLIANEIAAKESKFPQLEMKQDLNFSLTGTIGDKVSVDLDQATDTATPLANKIKIRYKGYDDEVVQKIDLGNTSLSLPGTQYATYSGNVEGLFGINALSRLGPVDVTTILSKQEGQNESKTVSAAAETKTIQINDMDYIAGKYFFLRTPNGCPWQLDQNSLSVFLDDKNGSNDVQQGAIPGKATLDGNSADGGHSYPGMFYRLQPGPPPDGQYEIQNDVYTGQPVLILNDALNDRYALAVTYAGWYLDANLHPDQGSPIHVGQIAADTLRLELLRPSVSDLSTNRRQGTWGPLANLELRNMYDLQARGILKAGFQLHIRLKSSSGGVVEPDRIGQTTFLQMTALDLSKQTDTGYSPGRDDLVDDQFISYQNGILHFPDLRPFDPDSSDLGLPPVRCNGFAYARYGPASPADPTDWVNSTLRTYDTQTAYRPRVLPMSPDSASLFRAPAIYDNVIRQDTDSRYYLEITYSSPVSKIDLGAVGILAGSETVTAGARTLVRDRDYRIDYDVGEVEILPAAGITESDQIHVTYSYLPFAGTGGQKTLFGTAASYAPEQGNLSLSTAWLFQSQGGVSGIEGNRPRLGQEPSRTLVGEVAGTYKTDSRLITKLIDDIPGVDTRLPTKIDLAVGAGISVPNPNTKNVLYIDDFDGVKDDTPLSMNRLSWRWSSIPGSDLTGAALQTKANRHGELWWYSPRNIVHERDLQPTLDQQEGENSHQVMMLQFYPHVPDTDSPDSSWAGLTTPISVTGQDFSRAQFLDIWVNDFIQWPDVLHRRRGKLHIDLGKVSEDAMWYKNDPSAPADQWKVVLPNGKLDTEDANRDGKLDQTEDVGLDGIKHGDPGADPNDVYQYDDSAPESDQKYAHVNGTEGNQILDTEDLDGDGQLETQNSYFEITVDLGDSTLWQTDVYRDYPGYRGKLDSSNGWRRIRIPLQVDTLVHPVYDFAAGPPVWAKIFHARLWVSGLSAPTQIELGGIDITGNRWFQSQIADLRGRLLPDSALAPGESFFIGTVNNKDDASIYQSPVTIQKDANNIPEQEQSITLNLTEFQPGHAATIYRTYPDRQDYTLYNDMQYYVSGYNQGSSNLVCGVRLCRDAVSDSANYYEYQIPVKSEWQLVDINLAALSRLQLLRPDTVSGMVAQDLGNGVRMIRRGAPSLNSVQRISFVVYNTGSFPVTQGSVWIDELRLTDVKKDVGLAARMHLGADLGGLARLDLSYQRTGADFLTVGADRGSGTTTTTWGFAGSSDNLFGFGDRLGLNLPVHVTYNDTRAVPKFRPNSDLILDTPRTGDISVTNSEEFSFTAQRKQSPEWWSRYLLEPFSLSGRVNRSLDLEPTSQDTSVTRSGSVAWNFSLEQWGDIGLSQKMKLRLIPTMLSATVTGATTQDRRYYRSDVNSDYAPQPSQDLTSAGLALSAAARPLTPVTYRIDSTRDLMLHEGEMKLFGMNLGEETARHHQLSASTDIPILRQILSPRVSWSGNSGLAAAIQTSVLPGEPARQLSFNNSRTTDWGGRLSLPDLFHGLTTFGRRRAAQDTTGGKGSRANGASPLPGSLAPNAPPPAPSGRFPSPGRLSNPEPGGAPDSNPGSRFSNPPSGGPSFSNPMPGADQNPTSNPATNPETSPATNPTTNPPTNPATSPATNPATNLATGPATNPATSPATNPTTNPPTNPAPATNQRSPVSGPDLPIAPESPPVPPGLPYQPPEPEPAQPGAEGTPPSGGTAQPSPSAQPGNEAAQSPAGATQNPAPGTKPPPSPHAGSLARQLGVSFMSLGAIEISYGLSTQTSYSSQKGEPSLFYQLAFVNSPGPGAQALSRATATETNSQTLDLSTNLKLPRAINVAPRYSRSTGQTATNGLTTMTNDLKWPDLDISWGNLYQAIGLGRWFQGFQANTHYSKERRIQGSTDYPETNLTSGYSPLLNVNATFKSGVTATLNSSYTSTSDLLTGAGEAGGYETENDTDHLQWTITFKKTLNLTKKIAVPMTKEVKTVQTRVDLNASLDYIADKRETRASGQPPVVTDNRASVKFEAGLGYQFTQRINGTGSLNFGKDVDKKNDANSVNQLGLVFTVTFSLD